MDIPNLYRLYLAHPSVSTDTRKIIPDSLFFALKGPNFNGNAFAASALAAGAAYAIVDEPAYATSDQYIVVEDVLTALQQLAHHHRMQMSIPFIGITGSNGKTTTKELVTAVLSKKYKTYATKGNLNNHIGVPLTILSIGSDAQMSIIEMGANHRREIASYCVIAEPTHGIITNCGKAHIEGFGGEEGVRIGKGELYDFLRAHKGIVFRNADLDYLEGMSAGIPSQVTYGTHGSISGTPHMNGVFLSVQVPFEDAVLNIDTQLVGIYNFANVMTAVAVGQYFGVSPLDIKNAIEEYRPDNSRSQWVQKGSNSVILDAYNANPTSMKAAIENFASSVPSHRILWVGAMKEMGEASEQEHRDLVALIARYHWDDVLLVGDEFKGLQGAFHWFSNSVEAANYVAANKPQNSSILIKGSRGSKMELLEQAL